MSIEIICPLYNAENYIENLNSSIKKQKSVDNVKITYILTESNDKSKDVLLKIKANFIEVKKQDFSHSLTREKAALDSNADIIVFITQDIVIESDMWLKNLTQPIVDGEADACFSRQISKDKGIEKYTREKNYPAESRIVSINDVDNLGLNTFFFSDASSAVKLNIFKKLNGFDGLNLPTNEDMYFAYKLIQNGYKIKYCADSVVYHSHKLSLKKLYNRYYLTGQFFAQVECLDKFNKNKSGMGLAKYVLKRALKDFNLPVIFRFPFDMCARYFGMKNGRKSYKKQKTKPNNLY